MTQEDHTAKAIKTLFNARSVALVGASNEPHKFGYMTLKSIIEGGFKGRLYPVNPKGGEIQGIKAYRSLNEIQGSVDLVIVIVPAKFIPDLLHEMAEKGVTGAIICSGGFREAGQSELEAKVISIAAELNIRLIGPNVAGINYIPNKLCAMFFPVITTYGPLSIISQSGTITNGLSEWAADEGFGISAAINLGNQIDLCESDFLNFLANDDNTGAVMLYIEGLQDGRRFLDAIHRTSQKKPVVVLKAGRTDAGRRAAASHTGSLAGSHNVFVAACRQYGAVVADDIEALYDYGKALAGMSPPKGNRVFSISTSGGAGIMAADTATAAGLLLPELPKNLVNELKNLPLSSLANYANPLDNGADLNADVFRQVCLLVDKFNAADAILLNFGDPVPGATEMVKDLAGRIETSLAVSYYAGGDEEKHGRVEMQKAGIPVFPTPERAMRAIGAAAWSAQFRTAASKPKETRYTAQSIKVKAATKKEQQNSILEPDAIRYLKDYNISYVSYDFALSEKEAVKISETLGYPVVLKIVSPDVLHKSDAGGVLVGLDSPKAVEKGYRQMMASIKKKVPEAKIEGVLVCSQAEKGIELIIGGIQDSIFGPTVLCGFGGIFTELYKDVSFRVAPIEPKDAMSMITELKGYPLLHGFRGSRPVDMEGVIQLIQQVGQLMQENPDITELDLNPIRVNENGICVLDVRIIKNSKLVDYEEVGK